MPPLACVYLLESRAHRRGLRTKREHWQAEGVFSSRAEAERFAEANERFFFHGRRVTAVPAEGKLAELLTRERRASMCIRVVNCKGLNKPEQRKDIVYVGRAFAGWPRHPLCNPATLNAYASRDQCLARYREHLAKMPELEKRLLELWEECGHGAKPLGCWCVNSPAGDTSPVVCHAQILRQLLVERFVDPECAHAEHSGDGKGNWLCAECGVFVAKAEVPTSIPQCGRPAGKGGGL